MGWFWALWALAGAAVEAWALRRKQSGDTLSESVRWITRKHPALHYTTLAGFLGFSAWFTRHIWG